MIQQRVQIIDVSHLFYKAAYGGMPPLSATIEMNGQLITVNTQIPTFVIKTIHRWSKGGVNPTIVCFDTRGGNRCRKAYFTKIRGLSGDGSSSPYKEGRSSENSQFYQSIELTMKLLYNGGVCCLKADNFEADDLVKAAVDLAKAKYPEMPIDIMTGDVDLVPLVDKQVSVFLQSRKTTYATNDEIKKPHYVQLTPDNYQDYMEGLSAYNKYIVPYNSILLVKLLRGDKSDGIDGYPKFYPRTYNKLVEDMQEDGVDFSSVFRYDAPTQSVRYNDTNEEVPEGVALDRNTMHILFGEPPKLTQIKDILSNYLDEDIVRHVERVYNGINLNGAFVDLPDTFKRRPAKINIDLTGYVAGELQRSVQDLKINLPML